MAKLKKIEGLLGPEVGYTDLLDNHLVEQQEKENAGPRKWNPLRPSASGYCARRLAYDFNEYRGHDKYPPEEREPEVIRLLNFGHSVEYHVLRMLGEVEFFQIKYKQQALSFFPMKPDDPTELIEGSTDFVIYTPATRGIGDVKSKKDKFRAPRVTDWNATNTKLNKMSSVKKISATAYWIEDVFAFKEEMNDPFLFDNITQLNGYARSDFMLERGVDHAFLYFYNKNSSQHRELRFKPSQELYDQTKNKFQSIAVAIDGGQGPEAIAKDEELGSIRCAFCRHKAMCWPGENPLQAFFATFRNKREES